MLCTFVLPELLREHHGMPGVLVSQPVKETTVTPRGKELFLEEEMGASISFPRKSVTKNTKLGITTSISGSFDLPENMVSVSPAYVINNYG